MSGGPVAEAPWGVASKSQTMRNISRMMEKYRGKEHLIGSAGEKVRTQSQRGKQTQVSKKGSRAIYSWLYDLAAKEGRSLGDVANEKGYSYAGVYYWAKAAGRPTLKGDLRVRKSSGERRG